MSNDKFHTRNDWRCHYCGQHVQTAAKGVEKRLWATVDHKVPRSRGGKGGDNKVTACMPCNSRKKDRTAEEYIAWLLPRIDSEETRL